MLCSRYLVKSPAVVLTSKISRMLVPDNPNTSENLNQLNQHFATHSYLESDKLSALDRKLYTCLSTTPSSAVYPHLARWCRHMSSVSSDNIKEEKEVSVSKGQPHWFIPDSTDGNSLRLYNSLTRQKDPFLTNSQNKTMTWYNCGPTVYDASHMGHARSYITFDILRRVLADYFGYKILYVMNVTDVDDKIIFRARTKYLLDKYRGDMKSLSRDAVVSEIKESVDVFKSKMAAMPADDPKHKMMAKALSLLEPVLDNPTVDLDELLTLATMPMEAWLDKKHGAGVTDHSIFAALSQHWEAEFHQDMKELNVLPPDVLTRVTDYVPEVIAYVERIIANGYGYESNGSVYFDSSKWRTDRGYLAKLRPESVGDLDMLAEGEGKLSDVNTKEKKNQVDFALWKASKPGEPYWESPWGRGRPGWHIECSCMADAICGGKLDIHSGGEDLMFPHHDNEILQAESFSKSKQWVNYFLHSGHLSIEGCKMSKSLKNFITIKDALQKNTARQLRIHFLSHSWRGGLDYSESGMSEAVSTEKYFNDFFLLVKFYKSNLGHGIDSYTKVGSEELELLKKFEACQNSVHNAMCDSIDTPTVMKCLKSIVSDTYTYLNVIKEPNVRLLVNIGVYVTRILAVFGVAQTPQKIGYGGVDEGAQSTDEIVLPFVKALSEFRDEVRATARELKAGKILESCDKVRNEVLPELGVRLEDREAGEAAVFKIDDKETLLREKQQLLEDRERKEKEKAAKTAAREAAAKEKLEKGKLSPSEMFKTSDYSAWDDSGLPTLGAKGEKITQSQLKKLKKLQLNQHKLHEAYLKHISEQTF